MHTKKVCTFFILMTGATFQCSGWVGCCNIACLSCKWIEFLLKFSFLLELGFLSWLNCNLQLMAKCRKYWTWKSNNKNNISNNFGNAPTLCFTLIAHMTNIRQEQAKLRAFFFMCLYSVYLVISSEILYNSNREREYHKSLKIPDWLRSFKKKIQFD